MRDEGLPPLGAACAVSQVCELGCRGAGLVPGGARQRRLRLLWTAIVVTFNTIGTCMQRRCGVVTTWPLAEHIRLRTVLCCLRLAPMGGRIRVQMSH